MMWLFIMLAMFIVSILSIVYLSKKISNFSFIKANKYKKILSLTIMIIFIVILFIFFSFFNVMTIMIHLLVISLIMSLIFKFIKKDFKFNLEGILVIVITTTYLLLGYINAHRVVEKDYTLESDKIDNLRIIAFADSHLGTTNNAKTLKEELTKINKLKPDVLVIVGDFVDDSTTKEDMQEAIEYISEVETKYGIYFVHGNHDKGYYGEKRGFSKDDLEQELTNHNINVLIDDTVLIDNKFYLIGRQDAEQTTRLSINELVENLDKDKYMIVLDHQPNDYDNEEKSNVDLVISGHTHGGQIFPVDIISEVFKVNDKVYGLEKRSNTNFLVTSGISGWELQFRTVTHQEYVVIDIK